MTRRWRSRRSSRGLPREVIYGVIRQESLYRSDAVSSANARGLMQLLPETARRTARDWKQPAPSATALFEPPVNVVLGAAHLKDLLDRFDDQLPLALAGYNAGPNAARTLAAFGRDGSGHLDREHPLQRDARLRAAHPLAYGGVRMAAGSAAAGHDATGSVRPTRVTGTRGVIRTADGMICLHLRAFI